MALKIIGAGFGRTGTLSLKQAIEELGDGPCYHMEEVITSRGRTHMWEGIVAGETPDWEVVFKGYQATVDWPGCNYYQELMAAYPDAKVILSVRDPERWYDSAYNSIYQLTKIRAGHVPVIRDHIRFIDALTWQGNFNGRFEDKAYAIQVFNEHIEKVKATVPPENLLVFNVKEGWEPLCEFLDVPVPQRPFPHVNDRATMDRRLMSIRMMAVLGPILTLGFALFVLFLLYRLLTGS